jgi:hypothetical protein
LRRLATALVSSTGRSHWCRSGYAPAEATRQTDQHPNQMNNYFLLMPFFNSLKCLAGRVHDPTGSKLFEKDWNLFTRINVTTWLLSTRLSNS